MRKILLSLIALLPLLGAAQSFTLTPDGFVNTDEPEKTYIVVEMEGTQAELFNRAKTAISSMWNSPKDVLSFSEPDIIIVNGYSANAAHFKKWGRNNVWGMSYRIQVLFKEGRIRIDAPTIGSLEYLSGQGTMYIGPGDNSTSSHTVYAYETNGKARYPDFNSNIEAYFNGLTSTFIDKMRNGVAAEDW